MRGLLLVLFAVPMAANLRPAALSAAADGSVFFVSYDCGLYRTGATQAISVARLGFPRCTDLAVIPDDEVGGPRFLITTVKFGPGTSSARIEISLTGYSASGRPLRSWSLPNGLSVSSVAADSVWRVAYVAGVQGGEIYALDLNGKSELRHLIEVKGASRLRCLTVDSQHHRLYAGDAFNGRLYVVDFNDHTADGIPTGGRSRELAKDLGETAALAVDPVNRRIFVADAARRQIWIVPTDSSAASPRPFGPVKQWREPVGLAVDGTGGLWVGDRAAEAVYGLSREGSIKVTLR